MTERQGRAIGFFNRVPARIIINCCVQELKSSGGVIVAHERHENYEARSGEQSDGHDEREKGLKQSFFLALVAVIAVSAFLVFSNASLVLGNAVWLIIALMLIYLVAKYDYILQLKEYERAVTFRLGRVNRVGGPGWALIFPPLESYKLVDLRTNTIDIPKQDVITADGIEIRLDAAVYIKVKDDNQSVINSVIEVKDYIKASELFVLGMLRAEAGKLTLNELIARVDELNMNLNKSLEELARKWGVDVEEAIIQDIDIPQTVLEAMHQQKAAVQKKLARIEEAQGHQAEIEAVKAAAQQLDDKTLAYYYIKALEKLGEGKSTKIIFPMELAGLAQNLLGRKGVSGSDLEELLRKYEPIVKEIAEGRKKNGK